MRVAAAHAQDEETIDISGNNTDQSYVSYNTAINMDAGKTVNVKMAKRSQCRFPWRLAVSWR